MQQALRRGITISVILLALAPTTYLVAAQTPSVTLAANPFSFVPHDASAVLSINDGSSQVIIFRVFDSTGYVIRSNPGYLYNLIKKHNLNFTSNATFSQVSIYDNAHIYELSNVTPISIIANTSLQNALGRLGADNSTVNSTGSAIYFTNPDNNIFILGSLQTVKYSLYQRSTGLYHGFFSSVLNDSASLSFAVRKPVSGYIDLITGNLTGHTLSVMVSFTQSLYAADFFGLYLLSMLGKGIIIIPVDTHTDQMLLNLDSVQFLPIFSLLQIGLGGL